MELLVSSTPQCFGSGEALGGWQGETEPFKEVFFAGASPGEGIAVPQAISTWRGELCRGRGAGPDPAGGGNRDPRWS